jgi:hypothetical protein
MFATLQSTEVTCTQANRSHFSQIIYLWASYDIEMNSDYFPKQH